jgi:hypothetical protein
MPRKKYVQPEPNYKDVCMQIDPNNNINSYEEWVEAVYRSQEEWPDFVKDQYLYLGTEMRLQGILDEHNRVRAFLEAGSSKGALIYHNYHNRWGFSWIIVDEFRYARLCESLGIANDFVLKEWGPGCSELVRRKTPPMAETPSTPVEQDNKNDVIKEG